MIKIESVPPAHAFILPMRLPLLLLTALTAAATLHAAPPEPAASPASSILPLMPIPLWPDGAPGALGDKDDDKPTLTAFLPSPDKATGAAMVICPGGGYAGLAPHEGAGYAQWLAENGIAGIVLKYRLASHGYHHPAMINDASRAMRLTRSKAAEWHIDPHRVGIMGSSAGGHLASTLLTHFDAGKPGDPDPIEHFSSRPDLGILCYAVITMGSFTHGGSRKNLIGENPPQELVDLLSNEKQVTKDTPPTFLFHTWEDKAVPVQNSLEFAKALHTNGVPFDLHIYEKGGHGMGLGGGRNGGPHHPWAADCLYWLKVQGWAGESAESAKSQEPGAK
jgi:acetyl esterase/lipase